MKNIKIFWDLAYNPYYVIVTNIELDHTDYYKDLDDVMDAFTTFVNKARKGVIMRAYDIIKDIKNGEHFT